MKTKTKKVQEPAPPKKGTHASTQAKRAPDREQNTGAKRSFRNAGRYARPPVDDGNLGG